MVAGSKRDACLGTGHPRFIDSRGFKRRGTSIFQSGGLAFRTEEDRRRWYRLVPFAVLALVPKLQPQTKRASQGTFLRRSLLNLADTSPSKLYSTPYV